MMNDATRRQLAGTAGLVAVAAVAAVLFSPQQVVAGLEGLATRPALFALALVAVYLVRPFLLWPVSAIALVLGYLYDPVIAFPVAILGAALTAMPPYLIGRYATTDVGLFRHVSNSGEWVVSTVGPTRGVIAGRFSPVPGDAVSYGSGMTGVGLRPFVAGTMVGEIPWALVAVFAGTSMRTLSLSEFSIDPALVVSLALLAVLLLSRPLYRRLVGPDGDAEGYAEGTEPADN
jgi:uncharacterized membrane protein YdjX (TVP38/TMEM64 family)